MRAILPLCLAICTPLSAQAYRGPVTKPNAQTVFHPEWRDLSTLVVKFREGAAVRLRDGRFVSEADVAAANRLLTSTVTISRLFQRSEADLDTERAALLASLPVGWDPPADLNNYFHLHCGTAERGAELMRALNELEVIETCFPEHSLEMPYEPGDISPVTPFFGSSQNYFDPAPTGVHQRLTRVLRGGRGEDLQVIDIESSWRLDHEDIPQLVQANVIGVHNQSLNPNHGVAVIGELAAEWDEYGVTGLVDLSAVKVHSHQRMFLASSVNVADANTPVGSFIVLEIQVSFSGRLSPVESRQDVFDAVRAATMAGKHVFAAAGNGNQNLDDPFYGGIFNLAVRDSGSVIVGATDGSSLMRASFSNHGSRVDVNGWGRRVTTTGYGRIQHSGNNDVRQQYTDAFSGTSSATPIATGAAMALTGAARRQLGVMHTPSELRDLMRQHGTDVPGGQIGKRPDLELLLAAVGLPDGLELTDATIDQTMRVDISGNAGETWILAASFDPDLQVINGQRLLLDTATIGTLAVGVLPSSGTESFSAMIPNHPTLRGSDLHMQALIVDGAVWRLTNSVRNYVW